MPRSKATNTATHGQRAEFETICKIADRARSLEALHGIGVRDKMSWVMDIEAAHKACPLKLETLLASDDFNFAHDVFGIARHLDRDTGELTGCFLPRFSAPVARVSA